MAFSLVSLSEMRAAHDQLVRLTNAEIATALRDGGKRAKQYVREKPGFVRRTGNLQRRAHPRVVRTSSGRILTFENDAAYARFIERGTKKITARWFMRRAMQTANMQVNRDLSTRLRSIATSI